MKKKNFENLRILSIIHRYLVTVLAVSFLLMFLGITAIQLLYQRYYYFSLLSEHVEDVLADNSEGFSDLLEGWTEVFRDGIEQELTIIDNNYLADMVRGNSRYITELSIIDENGIITLSSDPAYVGFDMHSGEQSAAFLCLLEGTEYYAQDKLMEMTSTPGVWRAYAGRAFSNGSGFVQMGVSVENLQAIVDDKNEDEVKHRHIGVTGSVLICDSTHTVTASADNAYNGQLIDNTDILPDKEGEYKKTRTDLFGSTCYVVSVKSNDSYIVGMIPVKEAGSFGRINRLMIVVMSVIIFLCMYLVLAKILKEHLVKGVEDIEQSLEKITDGNLDEKLTVKNTWEFKKLSIGVNAMVERLKSMIAQEKARIDEELEQAKTIQAASLPSVFPPYPNRHEFDIFATMDAAKVVGGDFYDFFMKNDDHLVLVVADVSGKGIPAALFMMESKTILRSMSLQASAPSEILNRANAALSEDNKESMFVTVWLGILEISTGKLTYASGGHTRAAFCQNGAWYFSEACHNGIALGMYPPDELDLLPEKYRIVDRSIKLDKGDAVFLYTDGVTEANDRNEELFGEERLLEALCSAEDAAPQNLLGHVHSSIDAFVEDTPQFDDITMLGIIYRGEDHSKR